MPKTSLTFVCRECGGESLRWAGQCPHCRAWNTLEEFTVRADRAPRHAAARTGSPAAAGGPGRNVPRAITEIEATDGRRLVLEWDELNRVLGGGIVPGSLVLISGEPGVGKSTLLMHVSQQVAARHGTVLYASGEESAQQVRMRAGRLGALTERLLMLAENDLDVVAEQIEKLAPALAVVDSIQTVYDPGVDSAAGSVSQVRESAARLMRLAKASDIPIVLVGHVTKEGAIAGPRILEHMVDTVLYLEGERRQDFRVLRANKNRFGSTEEIGVFAMGEEGMEEVADPSALLLEQGTLDAAGTAAVPILEGTRPLLVEIQSLVAPTAFGLPRRTAEGIDVNRLHLLLAILERRGGVSLAQSDVYVNVAGGIRITETASDLPLALSIAGTVRDRPLPEGTLAMGELGLTGEVRRVSHLERRLAEAARRGFRRAIIPRPGAASVRGAGLELVAVRDLREALAAAFGEAGGRVPAAARPHVAAGEERR